MKIKSIKTVGKQPVYDISVADAEHYVLANGVVTHNTGVIYSADTILIIGKSQEKDSKGLKGFNFTIDVNKSRFIKEKSKLPITVLFDKGIYKWSGIAELGIEFGLLAKQGDSHIKVYQENPDKLYLKGATDEVLDKWFTDFLENSNFAELVAKKYSLETPIVEKEIEGEENGEQLSE